MSTLRGSPHTEEGACMGCARLRVALLTFLHDHPPAAAQDRRLEAAAHLRPGEVKRHYGSVSGCAGDLLTERGQHYRTLFAAQLAALEHAGPSRISKALDATMDRLARDRATTHVLFSFDDFEGATEASAERRVLRQQLAEAAAAADGRPSAEHRYGIFFARVCAELDRRGGATLTAADRERVSALGRHDETVHGRLV